MNIIKFSDLPNINSPLDGGIFVGAVTTKEGVHVAVVLLPNQATSGTWEQAVDWAKALDAQLPTRPAAALIFFANTKNRPLTGWHWTSEELDASYAWCCNFNFGTQTSLHKSFEGSAVAVRLIQIAA